MEQANTNDLDLQKMKQQMDVLFREPQKVTQAKPDTTVTQDNKQADKASESSDDEYLDLDDDDENEELNLTRNEKSEMEDTANDEVDKEFETFMKGLNQVYFC